MEEPFHFWDSLDDDPLICRVCWLPNDEEITDLAEVDILEEVQGVF